MDLGFDSAEFGLLSETEDFVLCLKSKAFNSEEFLNGSPPKAMVKSAEVNKDHTSIDKRIS